MKYFISDLDGTLLQEKKRIQEEDIQAVQSLSNIPMHFGIATGRDLGFCKSLMKTAQLQPEFMILNNGGSLFVNEQKIVEMTLSSQEVVYIMEFLKTYVGALHPFICDEQHNVYLLKNSYSNHAWTSLKQELSYLGGICDVDFLEHVHQFPSPIIKLSIYVPDETQTDHFLEIVRRQFSQDYEVLKTANDYIEFTRKGVHKGSALDAFMKYTQVNTCDIIFIGDGENDIAMMDLAGYSFAMNTATKEVQQHADKVVASVHEAIAFLRMRNCE